MPTHRKYRKRHHKRLRNIFHSSHQSDHWSALSSKSSTAPSRSSMFPVLPSGLLIEAETGTGCASGCATSDRGALSERLPSVSVPGAVCGRRVGHGTNAWLAASAGSDRLYPRLMRSKPNTATEGCCYCYLDQSYYEQLYW